MADYAKEDLYKEYLVHLAVLTCDQATVEDFILPNGQVVPLCDRRPSRKQGKLEVDENPVSSNELCYATVMDAKKDYNIALFWCNCKRSQISREEMMNIIKDKDCHKFGVCRHLMKLEWRWSNMPMGERSYLEKTDTYPIFDGSTVKYVEREAKGITMTSVLFCKQGGIIYPETSGQDVFTTKDAISILQVYLSKGVFDENDVEQALLLLASLSVYTLPRYGSVMGNDYNIYDSYIIGWCEYYRITMDVDIDPAYIKSQIYQETRMGYGSGGGVTVSNVKRDIMQVLDIRNTNIYNYIGISIYNFKVQTEKYGELTGKDIWVLNNKYGEPGAPNSIKQERCGGIIQSLFNTKEDGSGSCYEENIEGTYYLILDNVTPIMSIGLGLDLMQELFLKYHGDYEAALNDYNTVNPNYGQDIINRALKGENFVGD